MREQKFGWCVQLGKRGKVELFLDGYVPGVPTFADSAVLLKFKPSATHRTRKEADAIVKRFEKMGIPARSRRVRLEGA